jgi:PAS domain S-box-containing protein
MFDKLKQLVAAIAAEQGILADRLPQTTPTTTSPLPQFLISLQQAHEELEAWVEAHTAQLRQANEQLRQEITQRQQIERALRESEAKYRELVENANSIILRLDIQGKIVFFNEFAQTFFGYSEAEILGQPAIGTIIPETETSGRNLAELFQDFIRNPQQYRYHENENLRRNKERVWVAWTNKAILDETGQVIGALCIGNDITDRHQVQEALQASHENLECRVAERTSALTEANEQLRWEIAERQRTEAALARSEAWFKALIQESTDAIGVLDRNGHYIFASPSVAPEPEKLIGKPCWDWIHPDDLGAARAAFAKMLENPGIPIQVTLRSCCNGDWSYLEISGRNLLNDPAVGGIVYNARDVTERQQAQDTQKQLIAKLQEAKDQLQAVLDAVPGCISWISADLTYLGVNHYLAQKFHLSPNNFINQEIGWKSSSPEFRDFMAQFFASPLQEASREMETTVEGNSWHYLMVAQKYWQGQAAVCVSVDITELKQTEEALRQSEEKFAKAFRASPDAITISTLSEGRFIDVNKVFLDYCGYQHDEVIGRTVRELNLWVNPDDRNRLVQTLQQQGTIHNQECEFRTKSGEIRTTLLSAEVITLEGELCLLALTNDITDRKQAERALQESAQREHLLGEIATRIRNSLDLDEILQTAVEEVRHFLQTDRVLIGYYVDAERDWQAVAESVDPRWSSCLDPSFNQDDAYLREIVALFEQGEVQIVEDTRLAQLSPIRAQCLSQCQVRAALGTSIIVDDRISGTLVTHQCSSPRHWQPWEISFLRSVATQVAIAIKQGRLYQQTRQLNHQLIHLNASLEEQVEERTAQLQQNMQELQELNRVKDIFLHAVSHDLRTPMLGMLMVLNNLLDRQSGNGTQSENVVVPRSVLQRMIQSSDRQLTLINSLLEAHASEIRGITVECEPVQLDRLVQAIIADLDPLLATNQAHLSNDITPHLPPVYADAGQLWRVFENLIGNALKYNPPGVRLTLTATVEAEDTSVPMLRCAIADDGIGMTPQQCEHLFDLYYRGDNTRHSTGIGLGLYLCRQIITAHGGEIGVISAPGEGATFWFTLPLAVQETLQESGVKSDQETS